nr:YraN family protein [Bifidobacterium indicum]
MDTRKHTITRNHKPLEDAHDGARALSEVERLIRRTGLSSRELGRLGEEYASLWLQNQGWRIVTRNWHCRYGELDIIALDPSPNLVFIEVKTRRSTTYGPPCEAVGPAKQQRCRRAAVQWLIGHDQDPLIRHRGTRFDVVTLTIGDQTLNSGISTSPGAADSDMRIMATDDRPERLQPRASGWSPDSIFLRHIREAF